MMILLMMLLGSMLPSQVQIRKLYQPQLFPNASVLPIFDKFFGPIGKRFLAGWFFFSDLQFRDLKSVCAVGFEPNILHNKALHQLEKHYQDCGWRVRSIHPSAGWWLRIALYPLYLDGMCWYKGWHHDQFNAYILPVKFIDVKSQRLSVHFRCISIWAQELEKRRKLMCHMLIRRFFFSPQDFKARNQTLISLHSRDFVCHMRYLQKL